MAQLSFSDVMSSGGNNSENNRVGFFSLKNDGDEALVRIMHDDQASFEKTLFSLHNIEINGKTRKINCIREAHDSTSACPLCANNTPIQNRVFINLIEYTRDERGNIVATPKVWERPAKTQLPELLGYLKEYGPLSKCMFKVIRHGAPRSTDTKYQFLPLNASNYPVDQFPITDAFNDYNVLGTIILNKNADEINEYLATGNFPFKRDDANVPAGTPYASSSAQSFSQPKDPVDDFMPQPQVTQSTGPAYDFSGGQGITKPTRFY